MSLSIKSFDEIKKSILSNISNNYEKSEGNLIYDIPAAVSKEISDIYVQIKEYASKTNVDDLEGDELARFVYQRKGIVKKLSTKSIGNLIAIGSGTINKGQLFETQNGTQFEALETVTVSGSTSVMIQAVVSGSIGNVGANTITLMPVTIPGIISITNLEPTYDGFEDESDVALRERYYEAIQRPATSGNKYHYLGWAKEIAGIGDARIVPLWNGDNTVKVVIIDADLKPASNDLINTVQNYIDPKGEYLVDRWTLWGTGSGQAPIGAYTTVISATGVAISVACDIGEEDGFLLSNVIANIEISLNDYFKSIAFKQNYVSYALIGSAIIKTEGVADYQNLLINGGVSNVALGSEEVAILGALTIT